MRLPSKGAIEVLAGVEEKRQRRSELLPLEVFQCLPQPNSGVNVFSKLHGARRRVHPASRLEVCRRDGERSPTSPPTAHAVRLPAREGACPSFPLHPEDDVRKRY